MRNFRMAYLILAHKNSTQINMLIDALTHDKIDIFIHLDLKSTIKDEIRQCENIYFVENRTDVEWGTVSQVYAMLNSLQVIYNTNKKYDYIHLISGQDFPLNKAEDIITFFYLNNGKQFLNMWEASGFWYSRVAVYYPKILLINNSIVKIIRGIYSRIIMLIPILHRNYKFLGDLYIGSQWFSITGECLTYILDYVENNPQVLEFYKNSLCPDELIINTIVANSHFKKDIINDNLRYIDWSEGKDSPKILTKDDLDKILGSRKLFGRKFDISKDREVIEYLLKYRKED